MGRSRAERGFPAHGKLEDDAAASSWRCASTACAAGSTGRPSSSKAGVDEVAQAGDGPVVGGAVADVEPVDGDVAADLPVPGAEHGDLAAVADRLYDLVPRIGASANARV
jgi:hypothetical protein